MPPGKLRSGWEVINVIGLLDELRMPALRAAIILDVAPLTVERWKLSGKMRTRDVAKLREAAAAKTSQPAEKKARYTVTIVFKRGTTSQAVREWAEELVQEYPHYLYEVQYTNGDESRTVPVRT